VKGEPRPLAERLDVHPVSPQPRLIRRAADILADGGLVLVPTDAGYSFAWRLEAADAEARVTHLRRLDTRHPFTVLCRSLSEAGHLARLDDPAFRLMRSLTPGPCTFVLPASAELPRRLKHLGRTKRRAIGIRLPDQGVARALLEAVGEPLLSTTPHLPDEGDFAGHEAEAVADRLLRHVDAMVDSGDCEPGPTTVVDCTGDEPQVIRQGHRPIPL
jgi:tRNA threonylcarbamoyl adenosine modification protein (Sua5/YciO/YrdC/YwlC family)